MVWEEAATVLAPQESRTGSVAVGISGDPITPDHECAAHGHNLVGSHAAVTGGLPNYGANCLVAHVVGDGEVAQALMPRPLGQIRAEGRGEAGPLVGRGLWWPKSTSAFRAGP